MITCSQCARRIEPGSQFCVHCGAALPEADDMSYFDSLFRDESEASAPPPEPAPTRVVSDPEAEALDATRVRSDAAFPPVDPAEAPWARVDPQVTRSHGTVPSATPARAPSRRPRGWVVLMAALAVLVMAITVLVGMGILGTGRQAQPTTTSAAASPPAASRAGRPLPAGATACSAEVGIGANTSCEFAQNVAKAVWAAGSAEPLRVRAYSPVTNRTYVMQCTRGEWIKCTGGSNSTVYVLPR